MEVVDPEMREPWWHGKWKAPWVESMCVQVCMCISVCVHVCVHVCTGCYLTFPGDVHWLSDLKPPRQFKKHCEGVRMAEWSKAPDSRLSLSHKKHCESMSFSLIACLLSYPGQDGVRRGELTLKSFS